MKYWECFACINLKLVSYSGFVYVQLISDWEYLAAVVLGPLENWGIMNWTLHLQRKSMACFSPSQASLLGMVAFIVGSLSCVLLHMLLFVHFTLYASIPAFFFAIFVPPHHQYI